MAAFSPPLHKNTLTNMFENLEIWWVTGAQMLYGEEPVRIVNAHSQEMVAGINASGRLPIKVVYKGTVMSSKDIADVMLAANADRKCVGIITWMHTFSPAKMWIHGLQQLRKPLLHLHTQYNAEIPWETMDMDFMNLNQSAHGDREFGHICARLGVRRKVVVGYWQDPETLAQVAVWARVAAAWADAQDMLVVRFGDQMNNVAVTDGDKVAAEMQLGYHVDYCPVSELMEYFKKIDDKAVDALFATYLATYDYDPKIAEKGTVEHRSVWNAAKAELAIRACLDAKGAKAFTTNFDDLGTDDINDPNFVGFDQIPGLASQRLMAEGYGFGAEGDWKSAALYRTLWVMNQGLGGCSFLEDYTLNFDGKQSSILQAHMLEVCPMIAEQKPRLEVHFLGIGIRKAQTARLVFTSKPGAGVTATVVDMGNRFRLIVNDVECIKSKPLPKLPVASALWIPMPDFATGAAAWILAGGTHHSCFAYNVTPEYWADYAEMAGIEMVHIDKHTTIEGFKKELRVNDVYYMLNK